MAENKRKFGCKEDLIILGVILCVVFMLLPMLTRSRRPSRRAYQINCCSNLKQIGLALKQYTMDYNDWFPPEDNAQGLNRLCELDYLTDFGCYVCPNSAIVRATTNPLAESNCSYIYLGGAKEGDNCDTPLAFDKPGNQSDYINVLFLDGHVKGYPAGFNSCEDTIIFLNKKCKYPEKLYKKLLSKAQKIDMTLPK
jgi:prepilin-type processing-associated H-X9-DG protein